MYSTLDAHIIEEILEEFGGVGGLLSAILCIIFLGCLLMGIMTLCSGISERSSSDRLWVDCTQPVEARVVDHKESGDIDTDFEYFFVKVEYEYGGKQYRKSLRFGPSIGANWDSTRNEFPIRSVRTIYVDPEKPTNISSTLYTGDRIEYRERLEKYNQQQTRFMLIYFGISAVLGAILFMPLVLHM